MIYYFPKLYIMLFFIRYKYCIPVSNKSPNAYIANRDYGIVAELKIHHIVMKCKNVH